ncbi:ACT domain-containing protein [Pseudomonas shirazensis]
MSGEKNLQTLLKSMKPEHNSGDYVFCKVEKLDTLHLDDIEMFFKEKEAITLILKKEIADQLKLDYAVVMAWITLSVHSSLEAVGLTAAFSKALSENGISCNVVAAYYHDHIFVNKKDAEEAMRILNLFSNKI